MNKMTISDYIKIIIALVILTIACRVIGNAIDYFFIIKILNL
jgi:hypothetical protein